MIKNSLLLITLASLFTACGSSDSDPRIEDSSLISPDKAIFLYQHVDSEYCTAIANVKLDGVDLELLEYSNSNKICEDYNRNNTPSAMLDDKNTCILYDIGNSSNGSCTIIADLKSNYYRSRSYKTPITEITNLLINK